MESITKGRLRDVDYPCIGNHFQQGRFVVVPTFLLKMNVVWFFSLSYLQFCEWNEWFLYEKCCIAFLPDASEVNKIAHHLSCVAMTNFIIEIMLFFFFFKEVRKVQSLLLSVYLNLGHDVCSFKQAAGRGHFHCWWDNIRGISLCCFTKCHQFWNSFCTWRFCGSQFQEVWVQWSTLYSLKLLVASLTSPLSYHNETQIVFALLSLAELYASPVFLSICICI